MGVNMACEEEKTMFFNHQQTIAISIFLCSVSLSACVSGASHCEQGSPDGVVECDENQWDTQNSDQPDTVATTIENPDSTNDGNANNHCSNTNGMDSDATAIGELNLETGSDTLEFEAMSTGWLVADIDESLRPTDGQPLTLTITFEQPDNGYRYTLHFIPEGCVENGESSNNYSEDGDTLTVTWPNTEDDGDTKLHIYVLGQFFADSEPQSYRVKIQANP